MGARHGRPLQFRRLAKPGFCGGTDCVVGHDRILTGPWRAGDGHRTDRRILMAPPTKSRANILGDLRAEADLPMLKAAFLETADYRTLIDTTDRPIVVGRRGTGKSALAYRLAEHWKSARRTDTISLAPTEEQIIGLRAMMPEFYGNKY